MTYFSRFKIILVFGFWSLFIYKAIQVSISYFPVEYKTLLIPGEEKIPFVPQMFFFYMLVYILPPFIFIILKSKKQIYKAFLAFVICSGIHFLFFIFMPVKYTLRPELETFQGYFSQMLSFIYKVDEPYNNFPSMHVSFAFLSYYTIKSFYKKYKMAFLLSAIFISASTVLVKQHYIVDVLAAILLASVINVAIIKRPISKKTFALLNQIFL